MLYRIASHKNLKNVTVPTLVMCGIQDLITPLSDHEAMAACVPGAQLEVIEDCGHLSTIEQPSEVNHRLTKWLQATDAQRNFSY